MNNKSVSLLVCFVALIALARAADYPAYATCTITNTDPNGLAGTIRFIQNSESSTQVDAQLNNLTAGSHGIHIHEKADFSNACVSTGVHYNPFSKDHGGRGAAVRHVGDMGNIIYKAGESYPARLNFYDDQIKLVGQYSVVGRAVVVHADVDDEGMGGQTDSKTTGHAGARLACCEI